MTSLADSSITFTVNGPRWIPNAMVTLTIQANFGDQGNSEMDLNHLTNTAEVIREALAAHLDRMHAAVVAAEAE